MNCPVCKNTPLQPTELDERLRTLKCYGCAGHWVQAYQYWKWLHGRGENLPEKEAGGAAEVPAGDSVAAKICPECGQLMTLCKVGRGLDFHLDRCGNCGGVWFDKNEWQLLKGRNLHDDVQFIFSAAWQKEIREAETAASVKECLQELLGAKDYKVAKQTREWLAGHPKRSEIMAFLTDE